MSRCPRSSQPAPRDYTSEIDLLSHQLAALTRRWHGVAPTPPSLAEAVEELTTSMEELHAMNEDLTRSQQDALDTQRRYRELFEGVPEAYFVTDLHGFIKEENRAAAQLLHSECSQLVGFPLASFIARWVGMTRRAGITRLTLFTQVVGILALPRPGLGAGATEPGDRSVDDVRPVPARDHRDGVDLHQHDAHRVQLGGTPRAPAPLRRDGRPTHLDPDGGGSAPVGTGRAMA